MLNWFQLGLLAVSTPLTVLWLFFAAFKRKKYSRYSKSPFAKEFQMSNLLCVGFSVMELLRFDTRSKSARAKIKEITEIRDEKYAEYYYYILQGAKITYAYTILVVVLVVAVLADSVEVLLLGVILCVLAVAYPELSLQDKLMEQREELLMNLPR